MDGQAVVTGGGGQAIQDLFGDADNPDEERLECMVKLLQTCGKKLDQTASADTMKVSPRIW